MALVVDSTSYTLVINSADKISGTNNNATYQVNWRDFLPDNFQCYKVAFSFQTIGGYYGDGLFSSQGSNIGSVLSTTNSAIANNNVTTITLTSVLNLVVGQVVICPIGIPAGTTILSISSTNISISTPTITQIPAGTTFQFYTPNNTNTATFSSARVLFLNQGRSFSFDTQNKGPSSNLGILQRDIQLASSKSNSLSCFYCQNPPRTIARPDQNLITVNIMNNYSFAGGIVSYNNGVPTYSSTATNQNFLTDTNATGSIISNDMTGYTMLMEFIPIASSSLKDRASI